MRLVEKNKKSSLNAKTLLKWVVVVFLLYFYPFFLLLTGNDAAGFVIVFLSVLYFFVGMFVLYKEKKHKILIQDVGEKRVKEVNNNLALVKIIEQKLFQITGGKYSRMHLTPPNTWYTGKVKEYWGPEKIKLKYELSFKDGQEHGKWRGWYSNGVLGYEATYQVCGFLNLGKKHGGVSVWAKNGKLQASLRYCEGNLIYK